MDKKKVQIYDGQNIFDVAVQEYGNVEAVFDLLFDNYAVLQDLNKPLSSEMELITYPDDVYNKGIVSLYESKDIKVNTGEYRQFFPDYNIDYNGDFLSVYSTDDYRDCDLDGQPDNVTSVNGQSLANELLFSNLQTAMENLADFDYAILRYKWTNQSGRDMDTRTHFTETGATYAGESIDEKVVGWNRDKIVGDPSAPYLVWGTDNTDSAGAEAVLIDFKKMTEDFPDLREIKIATKAFWYGSRLSGDIELEFETYKGGQMEQQDKDFINNGGTLKQKIKVPTNLFKQNDNGSNDGELLAYLTYFPSLKLGRINLQ